MKKYWKILPAAALILLYGGSLFHRPLFVGSELTNAALAQYQKIFGFFSLPPWASFRAEMPLADWINGVAFRAFGPSPAGLRLVSALAVLLTALLLYLLLKKRGEVLAAAAAMIFATTPIAFWLGTSVGSAPVAVLFLTASILCCRRVAGETPCREQIGYAVWGGAAAAVSVLTGGVLFAALFALYVVLVAPRARMLWLAPVIACGALLPLLVQFADVRQLLPVFAFRAENCSLLILGTLPWLLFFPVIFEGWRKRTAGGDAQRIGITGLAGWVLAACFPAQFAVLALAGTALLAVFAAEMLATALATELGVARFDRQVRTISILLCTVLIALGLIQVSSRFMTVDPSLILYRKHENWLMAIFTLFIPLLWWHLARKESEQRIKIASFAVGCAFLLLAGASMLPGKMVMARAPESLLAKYALPSIQQGTLLIATPKFLPALYRLTGRADIVAMPESQTELAALLKARKGTAMVLLDGFADGKELPVPLRKIWFKDANLYLWEFATQ